MANTLSIFDPIFYAQEALIQLEKALGLAGRVHRGYDATPQQKGSVISIRRPSVFTAQDAPSSKQDIEAGKVDITLNNWREVKFGLTDKELTFTKEQIISEHIRPAAYALADDLDQKMAALYKDVPWFTDVAGGAGSTLVLADVAKARQVLFDNAVPMKDPDMLSLMVGGAEEAALLPLLAPFNTSGASNEDALRRGIVGRLFGMGIFANQNTPSHTPGVSADATGTLNGAHAKGATTVSVAALTIGGTVKKGDSFVIAGHTQRYCFAADGTADGSGVLPATAITPALVKAYSNGDVVTINLDTHVANLAFHRHAFALATAPLSEMGNELGAKIATVSDPVTNLSLRSRVYYMPDISEVRVALDLLYGFITLNGNLANRLRG